MLTKSASASLGVYSREEEIPILKCICLQFEATYVLVFCLWHTEKNIQTHTCTLEHNSVCVCGVYVKTGSQRQGNSKVIEAQKSSINSISNSVCWPRPGLQWVWGWRWGPTTPLGNSYSYRLWSGLVWSGSGSGAGSVSALCSEHHAQRSTLCGIIWWEFEFNSWKTATTTETRAH